MYLDIRDYQTIWRLAHNWVGADSNTSDPKALQPEVREAIFRILVAIRNKLIAARTHHRIILQDEDFFDFLLEWPHYKKFNACLKIGKFDKAYLDSVFVWRPEVLRWCASDQLPIPPVWQPKLEIEFSPADEDDEHWYKRLTPRKKGIVAALHIAERLWQENPALLYEDVLNHPDMQKYNKPQFFVSLDSFKEWARDIAPQEAKAPGKRKKTKV